MTRTKRHLSQTQIKVLDKVAEVVEVQRAKEAKSLQPRFDPKTSPSQFFFQIYSWAKNIIFEEPKYKDDSRARDKWLRMVVPQEPYLMGVLQSVVSVDKNRGWTLIGGKNQVQKFTNILHNFQVSPDIYGWRSGMSVVSQNYYQSDLGALVEIARTEQNGPLAGLFTLDPVRCKLSGDLATPLYYYGKGTTPAKWTPNDYFRVVSMPSADEALNGLGWSAISRCIELAKLMVGVFEHDREKLGTKAPKGMLFLKGISESQWLQSLEESKSELKALEREYYSGVQVLAGDGLSDVDGKFLSLSALPENYDQKTFTDMIIYGYALAFGYDPREFWPVSGGQLGTSMETEQQHKKATGKGGLDFILGFQEKLQEELPETVDFEFEQRDIDAEISETNSNQAKLGVITSMFTSANAGGEALITQLEARQLMAEQKLIPEEWTLMDEEVEVSDTEDTGEMLEKSRVQRAMQKFPEQDIVAYSWPSGKTRVLKRAGEKLRVKRKPVVLYHKGKVEITDKDVDLAMQKAAQRLGKKKVLPYA